MSTRADYRTDLQHKLLAMEDGGYGDFEYDDTDLNFFVQVAIARLYPFVYRKRSEVLTLAGYGTNNLCFITPTMPERVYRVEDAIERMPLTGWTVSGPDIVDLNQYQVGGSAVTASVNVYFHDAFSLPNDDVNDAGISAVYDGLIVLGAQIEALEARQDTGVRGDPPPTGAFQETQLLDRLIPRYEKLRDGLAMTLPGVLL